jgi:aldehyde dehydrogenase (NAD+)
MTEHHLANSQLGSLEYDPAPESAQIAKLKSSYGLFIDGRFSDPSEHQQFASLNPATEDTLATVAQASAADVDRAVASARKAYDTVWSKITGAERAKYLYRIARIIQERSRELAVVETLDNGKPIRESRDVDIPLAAAHFFYYAGWADKLDHAGFGPDPQPVGVCGQIIPWNFPLLMAAWKLAPALATGNTCVLKPAETTPLSALILAEILQQAELPEGVVNILTGDGSTGSALVEHAGVDKIAFTGSTEVGRLIQQRVASTNKRLTLELGGKGANIVFDDAPVDEMIEGVIDGIFFNQGHVCCAGSRLLVQETIADEVLRRLVRRVEQLRVGDPMDKNTDVGAINSAAQLEKIKELTAFGLSEGATRYTSSCVLPEKGYWFAPTVFADVTQSHRIAREEIFGPVLSVLTFRTPEEAVAKANNTSYGLACGIWSEKGSRTLWVAQRLRAGVIWANTYNRFDPTSPFGGVRESGFGREGGRHGLEAYLNV